MFNDWEFNDEISTTQADSFYFFKNNLIGLNSIILLIEL